jgi:crotonobetainyl-CoA:carnitine CoA-transferase CaiB-like acyl-CoA transferase
VLHSPHPVLGKRSVQGLPWKDTEGGPSTVAAPLLGQHDSYVLHEVLGMSGAEIDDLRETGALR